ncbi:hypothetical protein [Salininema proteolyticum]|uniref:Uncharacterized protein n=1 Tax=Salininema proteolyticum TaxID=1607685 RepID=A0ABV8TVL2_9ACTN
MTQTAATASRRFATGVAAASVGVLAFASSAAAQDDAPQPSSFDDILCNPISIELVSPGFAFTAGDQTLTTGELTGGTTVVWKEDPVTLLDSESSLKAFQPYQYERQDVSGSPTADDAAAAEDLLAMTDVRFRSTIGQEFSEDTVDAELVFSLDTIATGVEPDLAEDRWTYALGSFDVSFTYVHEGETTVAQAESVTLYNSVDLTAFTSTAHTEGAVELTTEAGSSVTIEGFESELTGMDMNTE